jgi:hypothetical protein
MRRKDKEGKTKSFSKLSACSILISSHFYFLLFFFLLMIMFSLHAITMQRFSLISGIRSRLKYFPKDRLLLLRRPLPTLHHCRRHQCHPQRHHHHRHLHHRRRPRHRHCRQKQGRRWLGLSPGGKFRRERKGTKRLLNHLVDAAS